MSTALGNAFGATAAAVRGKGARARRRALAPASPGWDVADRARATMIKSRPSPSLLTLSAKGWSVGLVLNRPRLRSTRECKERRRRFDPWTLPRLSPPPPFSTFLWPVGPVKPRHMSHSPHARATFPAAEREPPGSTFLAEWPQESTNPGPRPRTKQRRHNPKWIAESPDMASETRQAVQELSSERSHCSSSLAGRYDEQDQSRTLPQRRTEEATGQQRSSSPDYGSCSFGPTSRLRHAGPMMFDCEPRRDPGVACSRFVGRSVVWCNKH